MLWQNVCNSYGHGVLLLIKSVLLRFDKEPEAVRLPRIHFEWRLEALRNLPIIGNLAAGMRQRGGKLNMDVNLPPVAGMTFSYRQIS